MQCRLLLWALLVKRSLADQLDTCLQELTSNGGTCSLPSGVYHVSGRKTIEGKSGSVHAEPGATVVIDGTKKLTNLNWQMCSETQFSSRCAPGVMVASMDEDVYQLFISPQESDDVAVDQREMLLEARWPNAQASKNAQVEDAPMWSSIFDTHTAWSFVEEAEHASSDGVTGEGRLVDNGGAQYEIEVEVEEGQFQTVKRQGNGYLKDAGFNATGAIIVIQFGKSMTEQGHVHKHENNELWFDSIPCDPLPHTKVASSYHTCGNAPFLKEDENGKEEGMLSYYLTNKLELLDEEGEWHFERKHGDGESGGHLFAKLSTDPSSYKFWGRTLEDYAISLEQSSGKISIQGLTFFASALKARKSDNLEIVDNHFLYSNAAPRSLPNSADRTKSRLDLLDSNLWELCEDMRIFNNIFRYSEGRAVTVKGARSVFENNLVEWNGYNGIDGPCTVRVNGNTGDYDMTFRHNTLRWNGQVSGFWVVTERPRFEYNIVERQNWGGLQNDGAGIHVTRKGQDGHFMYNWIFDGYHSMLIRFDTSTSTELDEVGRGGTVQYNVGWGGPNMVIKGEEHNISHNTIVGKLEIVFGFAIQCPMNQLTVVNNNAVSELSTRECTDGAGKKYTNLNHAVNNVEDSNLCDQMVDCTERDFRPLSGTAVAVADAGAYSTETAQYWSPGRLSTIPLLEQPANMSTTNGRVVFRFTPAGVIEDDGNGNLVQNVCKEHTVSIKNETGDISSHTLSSGENILNLELPTGKQYSWSVEPLCSSAHPSASSHFFTEEEPCVSDIVVLAEGTRCRGNPEHDIGMVDTPGECASFTDAEHRVFDICETSSGEKKCKIAKRDCVAENFTKAVDKCTVYGVLHGSITKRMTGARCTGNAEKMIEGGITSEGCAFQTYDEHRMFSYCQYAIKDSCRVEKKDCIATDDTKETNACNIYEFAPCSPSASLAGKSATNVTQAPQAQRSQKLMRRERRIGASATSKRAYVIDADGITG
mmetsp:Transcript_10331/g.17023  ORF Transcript_10331/g.17023 Transcript_10331/m.17023 type:complete len:986 (+) Transcript_10331:125-3082(+)